MITVDLLRHGELAGGIKYRGQVDDPLTKRGRESMDAVWEQTVEDVDLIISSPLSRCYEPAQAWAKEADILCEIDPRMAEMFYGQWEGLTAKQIQQRYPGMLERWRADPETLQVPDGESIQQLQFRVANFWHDICERYEGKHLLIVAHSGSLRMLITHILNAPIISTRHLNMPYGCWSRITHQHHCNQLVFHNREP